MDLPITYRILPKNEFVSMVRCVFDISLSFLTLRGSVIVIPHVSGLHHHYERKAAWCLETKANQFRDAQEYTIVTNGAQPYQSYRIF